MQTHERVHNDESFQAIRKRLPKTSEIFVGMFARKHPFFDTIVETPLHKNWKSLTIKKYDGNTNPDEHIVVYITHISLYT